MVGGNVVGLEQEGFLLRARGEDWWEGQDEGRGGGGREKVGNGRWERV